MNHVLLKYRMEVLKRKVKTMENQEMKITIQLMKQNKILKLQELLTKMKYPKKQYLSLQVT